VFLYGWVVPSFSYFMRCLVLYVCMYVVLYLGISGCPSVFSSFIIYVWHVPVHAPVLSFVRYVCRYVFIM